MRTLRQERIMRMQKLFLIVMVFLLCGLVSLCLFFVAKFGIRREKIRTFQKEVTLKEFDQITLKEKKEADASFNVVIDRVMRKNHFEEKVEGTIKIEAYNTKGVGYVETDAFREDVLNTVILSDGMENGYSLTIVGDLLEGDMVFLQMINTKKQELSNIYVMNAEDKSEAEIEACIPSWMKRQANYEAYIERNRQEASINRYELEEYILTSKMSIDLFVYNSSDDTVPSRRTYVSDAIVYEMKKEVEKGKLVDGNATKTGFRLYEYKTEWAASPFVAVYENPGASTYIKLFFNGDHTKEEIVEMLDDIQVTPL